ncbi:MAG: DUF1540 domain-containing protein [Firmicutes bacterium]|nr:DUF1540 domain-containing protein [Bacillota bacterium]
MTNVRCSVDRCEFWGEGQVCKADTIWVKNNMVGDRDDDLKTEFADEPGNIPAGENAAKGASAGTSRQTCCATMRPRREGMKGGGCCDKR